MTTPNSEQANSHTDLSRHLLLIVLIDCAIAAASYVAAFFLRSWIPMPLTQELMPPGRFFQVTHHWLFLLGLQPVSLFFLDTYHDIGFKRIREFAAAAAAACGIQTLVLVAVYFFTANLTFPRTVFPIFWLLNSAGVTAWRYLVKRSATRGRRRAVIVGGGPIAEQLLAELDRTPEIGLEVVGIVSDQLEKGSTVSRYQVLGSRDQITELIRSHRIEEVILTPEEGSWKDRLIDSISRLEGLHTRVSIVPSIYEILIGRIRHFNVRDIPLIQAVGDPNDPVSTFSRRLRDIAFSVILVIILFPLWIVVAIAIKLSDGGPVFYLQERVGQWGKRFRVYKFRTMPEGAEDETGPVLARWDDPRLTPLGRLLRSYRIDESFQLINVLAGDMSLVGPRPERPEFVARYIQEIHGFNERHKLKPGITGLAQVRGHYHSDPAIKLKYDLAYIYNCSFLLDLVILLETVRIVIRREGI
ncbi:MAG TPA: sugar transferase [Acidobacteriota bacterium]|nr:sugar transferase [Acidobacteriota bacterium]